MILQHDELNWKFSLGFDPDDDHFTLRVNDVNIMDLPYQAS